jgi:hypothetical protein
MLALRPTLTVVTLADGAEENWRLLDARDLGRDEAARARVEPMAIVDFYHAAEHLGKAGDGIWGTQSVPSKAEFARLRTLLQEEDSGVDKVSPCLRYRARSRRGRKREELAKALTYCRNQRWRMRDAQ